MVPRRLTQHGLGSPRVAPTRCWWRCTQPRQGPRRLGTGFHGKKRELVTTRNFKILQVMFNL